MEICERSFTIIGVSVFVKWKQLNIEFRLGDTYSRGEEHHIFNQQQ